MGMRRSDSPSQLSQDMPRRWVNSPDLWATLLTLGLSALGAWLGWMLGFPAYLITGPAIAVTLGGLTPKWEAICVVDTQDDGWDSPKAYKAFR